MVTANPILQHHVPVLDLVGKQRASCSQSFVVGLQQMTGVAGFAAVAGTAAVAVVLEHLAPDWVKMALALVQPE